MCYCKGLILILLVLALISQNINNQYNYKFTLDCMDEDNNECNRINIYTQNIYLNSHS